MRDLETEIKNELLDRSRKDQEMRNKVIQNGMSAWDSNLDKDNTAYLKAFVESSGWPTLSSYGHEAVRAAWLLVQHADHDLDFQVKCLELMKTLPKNEIILSNIAYLEDRILVAKGEPQLYGTQFYKDGKSFSPQPIKDEEFLEVRRAVMGLEPFEVNQRRIIELYGE